jgi:hypothetical protein
VRAKRILRAAKALRREKGKVAVVDATLDKFNYTTTGWLPASQTVPGEDWQHSGLSLAVRNRLKFWAKTGASPLLLQWIS